MTRRQAITASLLVVVLGLVVTIASFSFWSWASNTPKNIVFNTSDDLSEYIIYDEGESTFVGDFQVLDSFQYGIHSTIALQKLKM